ncbi:MAG: rod shape-determining protein RodA [Deltaproteobacteria bacterium]|nr:rod shape-determining protein RodA [Deltaproteobacteria bacterium]
MFDRRLIQNFDWVLVLLLLLITGVSLVNLYSATYPVWDTGGRNIFLKQMYWFAIGFFFFFILVLFDYHLIERMAYPIYFFSLGLLVLVLFVGRVFSGSQSWISVGSITFQPSEFSKVAIVIVLSKFFAGQEYTEYRLRDLWRPFLLVGIPFFLILKQPDLGTAMMVVVISSSIILFMKVNWRSLLILFFATAPIIPFTWFVLKDYQQKRILTFLNPETDPLGSGYNIIQSIIAVGSGLLWGKGYLKGTQTRLHFLPEQHSDFAFSVLAEEWGFAGSFILILLYLLLMLWGLNIAKNSKDMFGSVLSVGIVSIVFWQLVINVGMTIGLLPVVGIPLALFSSGGSSIISTMIGMGILMNISMRRFMFQ